MVVVEEAAQQRELIEAERRIQEALRERPAFRPPPRIDWGNPQPANDVATDITNMPTTGGPIYRVKCCGSIIQSRSRHDLVTCECGKSYVDGGSDYTRRGGDPADFEAFDPILDLP